MTQLNGPLVLPESGTVKKIVVFLHGLGADGNDLISLSQEFDLKDTAFVSPNAPFPCDMAPYGYQWFSLQEWTPQRVLEGARIVAPVLNEFLDSLLKQYGLKSSDLALVGFSQGTMMSLFVALRREEPIAGVLGYSGALVGPDVLPGEIKSKPLVCLIHGDEDGVVPYEAMEAAAVALNEAKVPVEAYTSPGLGHGIDSRGIMTGGQFLKRVLKV